MEKRSSRLCQDDLSSQQHPLPRHPSLARIVLGLFLVGGWAVVPPAAAESPTLQPRALAEIATLIQAKRARTPAQQKIDSHLLFALARQRDEPWTARLPGLRNPVEPDTVGRVLLDLGATVDDALLARVEALGGRIVSSHPRFDALRVLLPLNAAETLAAEPAVRWIRQADQRMTQMTNTTEGDVAHGTDVFRTNFGVDGSGIRVGAMSDSVDALADVQATGDLPPVVTVLPGQDGIPGTSEGTALLEIIHDMAPGADLFFATGNGGQAQMAQNILDLAAAGCDVIVDDVLYLAEGVFQDGVIAQAVDTVASQGVIYFSSAGNSGNLNHGTAGVFEGDYAGTALPGPLVSAGVSAHDFGATEGVSNSNEITFDSPFFFTLQWADPLGGATNDYDLFLLDAALSTVLAASTFTQNGSQDPFEFIDTTVDDDLGNRLVVVKFSGDDRFIHLNTHRGQLDVATDGQLFGHPAAEGALAIAAVNVATAGGGQFTGGAANPVEVFSSDGPRRIFFEADGSPISLAEGAPTSVVRMKPDLAAADGVSTATPGFNPFFGTSASAPHGAGMSALFKELFPSVSVPNVQDLFRSGALDIEAPGFDRDSGAGILNLEAPAANTIFSDGFESGNTSAWTDSSG